MMISDMNSWQTLFEIVIKDLGGMSRRPDIYFVIINKVTDKPENGTYYRSKGTARTAAANMFRAQQRKIEKALFG